MDARPDDVDRQLGRARERRNGDGRARHGKAVYLSMPYVAIGDMSCRFMSRSAFAGLYLHPHPRLTLRLCITPLDERRAVIDAETGGDAVANGLECTGHSVGVQRARSDACQRHDKQRALRPAWAHKHRGASLLGGAFRAGGPMLPLIAGVRRDDGDGE